MTNQIVFNSAACPDGTMVNLACGYVSANEIAFEKENIIVTIESRTGDLAFCDEKLNILLSAKIDLPTSGDEKFSEVKCMVADGKIKLGFPQYTYEDNYPHCDGEHDRWTKTISGFRFLCYDLKNNCLA